VAIHWFTDADRQKMREAKEEQVFLDALCMKYARLADSTPLTPEQIRTVDRMSVLQLRPHRSEES